jgi:elongator complex protein 2
MHPQATTNTYSAVLASGSADKTIKIWLWSPSSSASSSSWSCAATLQGSYHSAPITSIALHHDASRNTILLISTSGDGSVCIWQHNNNNTNTFASWHLRQKLQLSRPETALCAAISSPPPSSNTNTNNNNNGSNRDSWLILALGCIDGSVSLWVAAPHQGQEGEGGGFKKACKLQGHQDWIRGLDFIHVPSDTAAAAATNNNNSDSKTSHGPRLLLASASQDKYVRVWSIRRVEPPISSIPAAAGVANSGSNSNSIVAHLSKYAPRPVFDADGMCSAVLEALLIGHEDWVHSVQWKPQRRGGGGTNKKRPCLLSSSMDRTMMLWEPDVATGKIDSKDR